MSEVQRIAEDLALAGLTAAFYALTYLGFAAPYLLARAAHLTSYTILFLASAGLALATAAATSLAPPQREINAHAQAGCAGLSRRAAEW